MNEHKTTAAKQRQSQLKIDSFYKMPLNKKIIILLVLLYAMPSFAADEEKWDEKEYSRSECRWAVRWINKELTLMMGRDIIKKIITKHKRFEVEITEQWYKLDFNRQGEFLKYLSRARQVTGHSPFFNITDDKTKQVVARISEKEIEILFPEEGFFKYFPLEKNKKGTFY